MKKFVILVCLLTQCISAKFDLSKIARELKKNAPWSLQGSAQNLRSDIKHQLQQIMNQFTLLWPEATWNESNAPSEQNVRDALQGLVELIRESNRADWAQQAEVSLDYIILNYLNRTEQALIQGGQQKLSSDMQGFLGQKKELFGQLKGVLLEARKQIGSFVV